MATGISETDAAIFCFWKKETLTAMTTMKNFSKQDGVTSDNFHTNWDQDFQTLLSPCSNGRDNDNEDTL